MMGIMNKVTTTAALVTITAHIPIIHHLIRQEVRQRDPAKIQSLCHDLNLYH